LVCFGCFLFFSENFRCFIFVLEAWSSSAITTWICYFVVQSVVLHVNRNIWLLPPNWMLKSKNVQNVAGTGAEWWFACMVSETMRKEVLKSETAEVHRGQHANISCQNYKRQSRDKGRVYTMATQGAVKHYTLGLCFTTPWAPFTLYRIASKRSDFHARFGCCLRYATVIRYATWSKNHSALEVIWKVIRYVPGSVTGQSGTLRYKISFGVYV
jgi:hypothetical protein